MAIVELTHDVFINTFHITEIRFRETEELVELIIHTDIPAELEDGTPTYRSYVLQFDNYDEAYDYLLSQEII